MVSRHEGLDLNERFASVIEGLDGKSFFVGGCYIYSSDFCISAKNDLTNVPNKYDFPFQLT